MTPVSRRRFTFVARTPISGRRARSTRVDDRTGRANAPDGASRGLFRGFVRPYRPRLALATFLAVIQASLVLLQPWPLKIAVDYAAQGTRLPAWLRSMDGLGRESLAAVAAISSISLVVVSGLIGYLQSVLVGTAAERLGASLRHTLMDRMMSLSAGFHDEHRTGDLVSRLTGDVSRVQDALLASYTVLIPEALTLIGMVGVLLFIDPLLGVVGLAAVPPLLLLVRRRRRLVRGAQRAVRHETGAMSSTATDVMRNVRVVQMFQRQRDVMERFSERNEATADSSIRSIRIDARYSPMSDLVLAAGSATVLWIGVLRVINGQLTVGALLVILSYVGSVYGPVRSLSRLSTNLARGAASKERLVEVLAGDDGLATTRDPVTLGPLHDGIEFDSVTFGYEPGRPVVQRLSFTIRAGEHFCFVGPTGAGKSTVAQLLVRMYDPWAGAIRMDGVDLRVADLASLRHRFGVVPQQAWVMDGTIAENIAFGRPDATRAEIEIIGHLSLLSEFVDPLGLGYDTPVGENGARLSGGQLRRIAFARAAIRLPDVLLLDEPTTGLDVHSEARIIDAVERLRRGRTIISITHRLALAERADRVAVLQGGRVVELGAPAELRASGGQYAALLAEASDSDAAAVQAAARLQSS